VNVAGELKPPMNRPWPRRFLANARDWSHCSAGRRAPSSWLKEHDQRPVKQWAGTLR
jgi:hypothetical protein